MFMHSLGFIHEHQRMDRDNYVKVNTANVSPLFLYTYDKLAADTFDMPYQMDSLMHYHAWAFTVNNEETMVPLDSSKLLEMGMAMSVSKGDIDAINRAYDCPATTKPAGPSYQECFAKYGNSLKGNSLWGG